MIPTPETHEWEGICDGCAQLMSDCLCDIDLADVLDCNSIYHPGCRLCEAAPAPREET